MLFIIVSSQQCIHIIFIYFLSETMNRMMDYYDWKYVSLNKWDLFWEYSLGNNEVGKQEKISDDPSGLGSMGNKKKKIHGSPFMYMFSASYFYSFEFIQIY